MTIDRSATLDAIRQRLAELGGCTVDIVDDSHRHAGHAGAKEGGHFTLTVVAATFQGMSLLQRQRRILELLGDLRQLGIHALSIIARPPEPPPPGS